MILAFQDVQKWSMILWKANIECETYEECLQFLESTKSVGPCYLTVCGITQGAKLARTWACADLETFVT